MKYIKCIKARQSTMLSFKGQDYYFSPGQTLEIDFKNRTHYNNILSSLSHKFMIGKKEDVCEFSIPIIKSPVVLETITSVPAIISDPEDILLTQTEIDTANNPVVPPEHVSNTIIDIVSETSITSETGEEITEVTEPADPVIYGDSSVVEPTLPTPPDIEEIAEADVTPEFDCPICEATYKTQRGLNSHITKKHPGGK